MNYNKIKSFCISFRTILGIILITAGIIFFNKFDGAYWLFLGIIPLIAGVTKFCPLCAITKKCELPK